MRDIGKNLKQLREQKGLKQEQLAELLFVTRQTVSNYENGRSRPDIETLMKIAELLETDVNTVLYGPPALENRREDYIRLIVAFTLTSIFALLWLLGSYICANGSLFYSYHIDIGSCYYLKIMFFRPMTLLFGGWTVFHSISLLCKAKPMSGTAVKYARWFIICFTTICLLSIVPYLDIWFGNLFRHFFQVEWNYIDFHILDTFGFEIVYLNTDYVWVYFFLGALLWLFGFPQKKKS